MSHQAQICPHCGTENHHHGAQCVKGCGSLAAMPGSQTLGASEQLLAEIEQLKQSACVCGEETFRLPRKLLLHLIACHDIFDDALKGGGRYKLKFENALLSGTAAESRKQSET